MTRLRRRSATLHALAAVCLAAYCGTPAPAPLHAAGSVVMMGCIAMAMTLMWRQR